MSLKGFHLLFVTLAIVLAIGTGIWALEQPGPGGPARLFGLACFLLAAALVAWEIHFLRGMRDGDESP